MAKIYLINFLNLFINAYMILIFIRVIMSWIPNGLGAFGKVIFDLTEPVLAPARKIIPPIGGLDLSPIIVFIILQVIQSYIATL